MRSTATTHRFRASGSSIPADDKPFMRQQVAEIVVATLESLELEYPGIEQFSDVEMDAMRTRQAPEE